MIVRDIMTRSVISIDMDASLEDVSRIFDAADFRHLVVVEGGVVVGVLSDRDQMLHLSPFVGKMHERTADAHTLERRVHQFMTRRPETARADEPLADAARRMLRLRISCLPVVDEHDRLEGILTLTDIAGVAADLLDPQSPNAA